MIDGDLTNDINYEREAALLYQQHTGNVLYYYDYLGREYWYTEGDNKKHYTYLEG